jgi:hypothetical protein
MSQPTPYLTYPGGCPAFFTDLHLNFSRWLRLVALVPLVHASVNGISYDELCSHLLGVFPSSNSSSVLAVSVERIRSFVTEMLLEEPFFVVRSPRPRTRFVVPYDFATHDSALFRTVNLHCQHSTGFMNRLSILTPLESRLPLASCDA